MHLERDGQAGWAGLGRRIATAQCVRVAAAVLLAVEALVQTVVYSVIEDRSVPYTLLVCVLALAATVPIAVVDSVPATVTITVASLLSVAPFHSVTTAGVLGQLLALYLLAGSGSTIRAMLLTVPYLFVTLIISPITETGATTMAVLAPIAAWIGVTQHARQEAVAKRTAQQAAAGSLLAHTARGERARIARELHDVVAHHISVIAVQAETARLTTPGMPAAGAQRLTEIGDTARAGLTEMRRLLGVLREDAEPELAERQPQPGLHQLNELLDEARHASGTGTRLIMSGAPVPLDPGVELAAYRIVQEALTNARRHAPGAAVDVELHYTDDELQLRIRDNGPGSAAVASPDGHGLLGMRERAAAVGGRLRSGPAAIGGFLVEATLPAKLEAMP